VSHPQAPEKHGKTGADQHSKGSRVQQISSHEKHVKKVVQKAVSVLAQSSPNVCQLHPLFSFVFLCSAVDVLGLLEPHSHSWSGAFITECRMARDDFFAQKVKAA